MTMSIFTLDLNAGICPFTFRKKKEKEGEKKKEREKKREKNGACSRDREREKNGARARDREGEKNGRAQEGEVLARYVLCVTPQNI